MTPTREPLPTIKILNETYTTVKPLLLYLVDVLELDFFVPPSDTDPLAFRILFDNTFIATNKVTEAKFQHKEAPGGMGDAIKKAQMTLFQAGWSAYNILKLGYRLSKGGHGIESVSVNTIITALLSPEWEILLQRTGITVMLHLLIDTSIFVSLPNGCLCQMTGEPLNVPRGGIHSVIEENTKKFLKRASSSLENIESGPPSKRRKLGLGKPTRATAPILKIKTPSVIPIVRVRMFYARPNRIPGSGKIVIGLPLKHVFNINRRDNVPSKLDSSHVHDPDNKAQELRARHVMRYIFARQHNLVNPFHVTSIFEVYEYGNYLDREDEIRRALRLRKVMRTPKRLKDIVPLVDKMLWRHYKCPYKLLLDKLCPSKVKIKDNVNDSTILEWMSERSIQLQTQGSYGADTTGVSLSTVNVNSKPRDSMPKPRFAEFACSYIEVYRYVVVVCKAIIPKSFWGSRKNFNVIMNSVKDFITSRRLETLSLHNIMQGFSTSDCDWLIPPGPGARQQHRVSVTDALKRKELLEEFLVWFFDSFVLPLIRTCFYVTESSAFRNRVLYFRQDDWVTLCLPLVERLRSGTFTRISETEASEIMRQRGLGFSFVRLLPKETGVRPIINLRRKQTESGSSSINKVLETTFHLLTYEKQTRPELTGVSVRGSDEVYTRLMNFKSRLRHDHFGRLPKLYFVKVDVQACFDTIDQGKLLAILRELISEDTYTVRKYSKVRFLRGQMQRTQSNRAYPRDEEPHFLDMAMELASALRHTIFVDQSVSSVSKNFALDLLNSHISDNIVKIGGSYHRQTVGIPQGSILSSLLCSFFYGDLERQFGSYTESEDSTLLRMTDDYLLITTNQSKARSFLDMMNKGHPEYGCFITKEKTMSNFDYDHQVMNVVDSRTRHFYWCGYAIDMKDLSVSADYTRYHGLDLSNTLTVSRGHKPGERFVSKMLFLAKIRGHTIYTDPQLNRKSVIYLNIYQNLLLAAMKMHCYLREWSTRQCGSSKLIRSTVQKMIYHSLTSSRKGRKERSHGFIQKTAVMWLGYYAFYEIFSRKSTQYRALTLWLKRELDRPIYRSCEKRFCGLAKDGLLRMSGIVY
ncbi:hypothetical protein Agabi119p4_5525 [Agaricus bisporus var. burnettii]|uniref:Telomerase reverse transcriptase n=1 Tax=Agaricus bisporus var. burnettii TaxID=192524 RepID=A0A8H7F1V6_AGABI|nr:hypothetical protein Agabi119p4_5525 [Agaricus bisporus var. burnettii]